MELADIVKKCSANPSGTGVEILFAPMSYFATIEVATPLSTATTADQIVKITGNHVFTTGKGFHKLKITPSTGGVKSEKVGEIDAVSFNHTFEGFVPNNYELNTGLLTLLSTCDYVFLIPEATAEGKVYRQVGSELKPANCEENNYDSGKASGDRRGTALKFSSQGNATHCPYYAGTITMHP